MADEPGVAIYDTTLRDGTQREGISLSGADKLRIARRLDELGVAFIEAGWPGSNPKDAELFARARDEEWRAAEIVAFGATCRSGATPEDDLGLRALVAAGTRVVTIFGKSSTLHVTQVLRTSLDENLRMIEASVAFLREQGRRVIYDAEHFFDGYVLDAAYALETLHAAIRGGAETVVLCDTNGGTLPWQIGEVVATARDLFAHPIGIHTHDDGGCGVANALAAVRAGARHVQGTINGYGERCGNANLCVVIPDLELKLGTSCLPAGRLGALSEVSRFVAEVANLAPDDHMPYVGKSAFAHKGGVHVAAMRRTAASYQHVEPALVGNRARFVVSELSGKATLAGKAEEHGVTLGEGGEARALEEVKRREAHGMSYEAAEASAALVLARQAPGYRAPFTLVEYRVTVRDAGGLAAPAEATVKIVARGETVHTAAEGIGPVHALDAALRKALTPLYPEVARIALLDYKVRILDGRDGTGAVTRVLLDSGDGRRTWSTAGASPSIIAASWQALADGIEYGLWLAAEAGTEPVTQPHERRNST